MSDEARPPSTPLQFDKAEYSASTPAASTCTACKSPLTQNYYVANKAILCDQCHSKLKAFLADGSRAKRVLAATALGLLASLAGATIWYAVRKFTGYEIGLIAIAVGLMVGVAVRKGSKGRGGWFYQTLAIVLTYSCICAQYVPDLVEGMMQKFHERHAVPVAPAKNPPGGHARDKAQPKNAAAEKLEPDDTAAPKPGIVKTTLSVFLLLIIAFIVSLALPFLAGVQNLIGLLIIGFALYEAWKINKGSAIRIFGPFQIARPTASEAPGG